MNDSARLGLTTKELPNELEFCFAREQSGTMQIVAIVLALVSAIAAFIPASLRSRGVPDLRHGSFCDHSQCLRKRRGRVHRCFNVE